MKEGTEKARKTTERTLSEVKAAMKIDYFADDALISEWEAR